MLTKISVKNFKKLQDETIDLNTVVVFVGPNNSGKTSALQAIALWELGMRKWAESRKRTKAKQRTGVTINRRDILAVPVPSALQLWFDLNVRKGVKEKGKRGTKNIVMEIRAEGFTSGKKWRLGFEFDYANSESIYCRILKDEKQQFTEFPEVALKEKIGILPPMSGLASIEDKLERGSINVRIGEGRTAEVLRNLCWIIVNEKPEQWKILKDQIKKLFFVDINSPYYDTVTGRISMSYCEGHRKNMDLSNSGRGFQQILLLLAFIYSAENTILLLDEPDAHLELIRQRETYNLISEIVRNQNSQLIVATHSEVILDEAVEKDTIVAFIGRPHIVNKKSQVVKSLTTIGYTQYLLAQQKKWVLYLEGSTDLAMLRAFAKVLEHPASKPLEDPFVKYVTDLPQDARKHFYGLKEAVPSLQGVAIFDNLTKPLETNSLKELMWNRREIENYIPILDVIPRYLSKMQLEIFQKSMDSIISGNIIPNAQKNKNHKWWFETKISDLLDEIFRDFFNQLNQPIPMNKSNYYELILLAEKSELDNELIEKLDTINDVANIVS